MLPSLRLILIVCILLISPRVFAHPNFASCGNLSGPASGLCKAARALGCNQSNPGGTCATIADRFKAVTGSPAPWLEGPSISCTNPVDGAFLKQSPGSQVTFQR